MSFPFYCFWDSVTLFSVVRLTRLLTSLFAITFGEFESLLSRLQIFSDEVS